MIWWKYRPFSSKPLPPINRIEPGCKSSSKNLLFLIQNSPGFSLQLSVENTVLTLPSLSTKDTGTYTVTATNSHGAGTLTFSVVIIGSDSSSDPPVVPIQAELAAEVRWSWWGCDPVVSCYWSPIFWIYLIICHITWRIFLFFSLSHDMSYSLTYSLSKFGNILTMTGDRTIHFLISLPHVNHHYYVPR